MKTAIWKITRTGNEKSTTLAGYDLDVFSQVANALGYGESITIEPANEAAKTTSTNRSSRDERDARYKIQDELNN